MRFENFDAKAWSFAVFHCPLEPGGTSSTSSGNRDQTETEAGPEEDPPMPPTAPTAAPKPCLLYTSDAADEP